MEKQEARIQVVAQDLDHAQYVADTLQQALNEREIILQDELGAADMSNQMISAQEDELARLYDILEAQRGEIENLNQMLDYLATQGPDGVGPGFDDELWRIRQEVNKLKETLAMQSAYVQAMPSTHSFGAQAGFPPPLLHSSSGMTGDPRANYPGHLANERRPSMPMPVAPIATGTPVRGGHAVPVNFDGSYATAPPSPIRSLGMESPTRGILKNSGGVGTGDDSYLFCNVPEHHDLEDYIAELQEKIKRLKSKLFQEKQLKSSVVVDNDKQLIKRLLSDLEDRRDELEGLDLAIERQKRSLKEMKREERSLKREHKDARGELGKLRDQNIKKLVKISRRGDDDSFDEAMERNRQRYLQDELECLERTLAKRQTQLREAERSLKETNADLKEAKEQARETVKRYDEATSGLHNALSEHKEIDRRSNEVGLTLVKSMDELAKVKADLKDLERKRHKQERLLKDINQVIAKKDTEFRDLDGRVKVAQQNLEQLQGDLAVSSQREKETVDALRDSEDILSKRRAEIARMREQYAKVKNALVQKVDSQRAELERLDQQVGRKRTEVQLLQENQDRRQAELNSLLRQAEAELTAKQREIKVQEEVQQEEEVLQRLTSSVNKNKTELKHTYEMQKLEQNELENLRAQHAQKMARPGKDTARTSGELEQLNAETSRKAAELDRLRQSVDKERADVEALTSERNSLEERIATLSRERGIMEDSCRSLDDKLNTMKRTQRVTEEKLEVSGRRLETLEEQLTEREREMEDANLQRTILQKDVQMLKNNIKESQTELEQLRENISDAESMLTNLRQDLRSEQQKRDDAHVEAQRLGDVIRQSSAAYEEAARQERAKQDELQDLIRSIEDREREHEDARKALNRLRKEIEKEENKLNKLLTNANSNLEQVRADLVAKQEELDKTAQTLTDLKREASQLHANGEQFAEMQKHIQELEKEMEERNKEKNELANALSVSYEEVQRLRKESTDAHEKMRKEHREFENSLSDIQQQLEHSKQELHQVQERSTAQVTELQTLAEQQFKRANALSEELDKYKRELIETKKQAVQHLSDDKENQRVSRRAAAVLARDSASNDWTVKHDRLRERLVEEQDYLRFQLQQQMARHNEMMDSARKKSDETIDHLKQKLNSLQEVLQADGGNYCASVNAATLAIIDAGIPMKDYVCACSAGFIRDTPIVDINHLEESSGGPELIIATLPKSEQVVFLEMNSRLHEDNLSKTMDSAIAGCRDIFQILDRAVKEHVSETSAAVGAEGK
nr:hypothetical protein BaRGS_016206 [Batillaria attramentaria]